MSTTEPPITLQAVHTSAGDNLPVSRIVIHATAPGVGFPAASGPDSAHGTAMYFQQRTSGGSAHYVCSANVEEHCVHDGTIAWHAPPNQHSLGIEINAEATYTRTQWTSPQVWPGVQRAARRCRELCDRHQVPVVKLSPADLLAGRHGICGHVDVSQAWRQTDHTDPGPGFPWDLFLAEVGGSAPVTPTPPPRPPTSFVEFDMAQLPVLGSGDKGVHVYVAQWLIKAAAVAGLCPDVVADSDFGPATTAAVRAYQTRMGLPADGVVGLGTYGKLLAIG